LVEISITRSNSIIYDPRVIKMARSLSKRYSVAALGWNREGLTNDTVSKYIVPLKLHNQQAPYGKASLILHYPKFWIWIFYKLIKVRPRIVHACDLDTVIPCYLYKVIFGKKLVFEIIDRFALANIPQRSKLFPIINSLEEWFVTRADAFITVSEKYLKSFKKVPKNFTPIINCPEYHEVEANKSKNELFTIVYTGSIMRGRGIERIVDAISDLDGVEFVLAGRIPDKEFLDKIIHLPKVKYRGLLEPSLALSLEASSDAIISLYDLTIANYNFAMPNKTFEAMMFGVPLITNVATELISEIRCGIKVDYNDLSQIRSAIVTLRDNPQLRKTLGDKGRIAFEEKYNWGKMEEGLFGIYEGLLK
jgi:glycosyltransferase involved in cell wall biosynthesis